MAKKKVDTYELRVGLNYPVNAEVDAKILALRVKAADTSAPADVEALNDALCQAKQDGTFVRAEAGDRVSNLLPKSIPWLLEQGLVVLVNPASTFSVFTKAEE